MRFSSSSGRGRSGFKRAAGAREGTIHFAEPLEARVLLSIVPRWQVIGPGAANQPAGSKTYSLVVDLRGASLFNVAGLQATLPAGSSYFNQVPFGTDTKPSAAMIAAFPDLANDTYVATTNAQAPFIPGRYVGPGAAIVGEGQEFNVAWGATPNTGPVGGTGLEIARLTVLGGGVPSVNGEVRSSDAPNDSVPIPFIPRSVQPDLVAHSVTYSGSSTPITGSVSVQVQIRNQGQNASASVLTRLLLSSDQVLNAYDAVLSPAQVTIPSIPGGGTYTLQGSFTVPLGIAPGNYYVGALVDVANTGGQADITNDSGISTTRLAITSLPGVPLPVITQQPQPLVVDEGGSGQLTVVAGLAGGRTPEAGPSTLKYQWFRNGVPVLGQTAPQLKFSRAVPAQAGNYSVSVANAAGAVLSTAVQLAVNAVGTQLNIFRQAGLLKYPSGTIDPTKPTVIVTHGWQPLEIFPATDPDPLRAAMLGLPFFYDSSPGQDGFLEAISTRLDSDLGAGGYNLLGFVWAGAFTGLLGPGVPLASKASQSASNAEAAGIVLATQIQQLLGAGYNRPLHMIGHSHGAIVNAVAVDNLRTQQSSIDVEQVTMLDAPRKWRFLEPTIGTNFQGMYEAPFFYDRLPASTAPYGVDLVENYYGTKLVSATPGFGAALAGALPAQDVDAPEGARDPNADHTEVWENYLATVPQSNSAVRGFDYSVVLGAAAAQYPSTWPGGTSSVNLAGTLPTNFGGAGSPGWNFNGNSTLGNFSIGGQTTPGFTIRPPSGLLPEVMGESSMRLDLAIPAHATSLLFDYRLSIIPADSKITVAFNGTPLSDYAASQSAPGLWQRADAPVGLIAGEAGVLSITLSAPVGSATELNIANLRFVDVVAPTAEGEFQYETGHAIKIYFSESIGESLAASEVLVRNLTLNQLVPANEFDFVVAQDGRSATLTRIGNLLPDANYKVTLPAGSVVDNSGFSLAQEYSFDFFVLAGDANRDRKVTIGDFSILGARFNQAGTFSQGDFNYSGVVEIGDFSILASRFNTDLPPHWTFAPTELAVDPYPQSAEPADINGDGKLDLVVAHQWPAGGGPGNAQGTVGVLLNQSQPGSPGVLFAAESTPVNVGQAVTAAAVGDFNSDGRPDVVTADAFSDTVSVLINATVVGSSTVSFEPAVPLPTADYPFGITVVDLNRDGRDDIVATNSFSHSISVFLNTTTAGVTSFAQRQDQPVGTEPYGVEAGDLDGDGDKDLAVINNGSSDVTVLVNQTPAGGAVVSFISSTFTSGRGPRGLAIVDLNRDGRKDLVTANGARGLPDNNISVLLNRPEVGTGAPVFDVRTEYPVGSNPHDVAAGDIDDDGVEDLVVANFWGNSLTFIRNVTPAGAAGVTLESIDTVPVSPAPIFVAIRDLNQDDQADVATTSFVEPTGSVTVLVNRTPTARFSKAAVGTSAAVGAAAGVTRGGASAPAVAASALASPARSFSARPVWELVEV